MKLRVVLATVLVLGVIGGCGAKKPPKPMTPVVEIADAGPSQPEDAGPKALYDRLGGKDGVSAVIDSLVKNVAADPELKKIFAKTTGPRLDAFKQNLATQLCAATGGPCQYKGRDMKEAHKGMKITDGQWDKFVQRLTDSLNELKVADAEQSELLALLAPMKEQVVQAGKKR